MLDETLGAKERVERLFYDAPPFPPPKQQRVLYEGV